MEKSTSIQNISKALVKFHQQVSKVNKDSRNPFFKSKYASLANILDTIGDPLENSGLIFSQFPENGDTLTTILMHPESGEFISGSYEIRPEPEYTKEKDKQGNVTWRSSTPHYTPQAVGSAITYARRYALVSILGLNVDDDDDGNAASGKKVQPQPQQQAKQQAPAPEAKPAKPTPDGKQFQEIINRITAKEEGILEKIKAHFTFTEFQVEAIQGAIKIAKSNLPPNNTK